MHQFFYKFGGQPKDILVNTETPDLKHNLLVLEMYNNWPFVRCMMFKHREGRLKKTDIMEGAWMKFVIQNNIDTESDKSGEEFIKTYYKDLCHVK